MRAWLTPLSWLYGLGAALDRARPRTLAHLPAPVISVGNLTTGGTGKTEAVAHICRALLARGLKPAVLTRGYRRRSREAVLVVSRGRGPEVGVAAAGDEPYLLAQRLPGVAVLVGADRAAAGWQAILELHRDVLVLDDGFQRRHSLHRDLDVVLVDAADPFGGGRLLPAGTLREPLAALAEAGLILLTRADQHAIPATLARLNVLAPGVPVLTARHRPQTCTPLDGGSEEPAGALAGKRVLAVSGIARPQAFLATLAALGAQVAGELRFADHHWYTESDRARIRARAQSLNAEVATTAKDAVRLGWTGAVPRARALNVELEILTGADELDRRLDRALARPDADPPRSRKP